MTQNINPNEFVSAVRSVKMAKNVLLILLVLAVLAQVIIFAMVEFSSYGNTFWTGPTQDQLKAEEANTVFQSMLWTSSVTQLIALICGLLLVATLMLGSLVSILGSGNGTAGFLRAFFFSLILAAMVVPWQKILQAEFAAGALFNMGELEISFRQAHGKSAHTGWVIHHYGRFFAFPLLVLLVALLTQLSFSRGYRRLIQMLPAENSSPPTGSSV